MRIFFYKAINNIKVSQEYVATKYKYHLRKLAIKRVRKKLIKSNQVETNFTKDEMRIVIQEEEKKILKDMGAKVSLTVLASLLGLSIFR